MKINNLTIKQEAFCQAYIRLGDKSAAYREAYNCSRLKDKSIHELSSALTRNIKVSSRIEELQSEMAVIAKEKFQITAEEMLRHLNILRNARIDQYVNLVYEKVLTALIDDDGEPIFTEVPRVIFKPFDELTPDQLMCIESVKVNRYGEVELKLHGKEWTIEKINKHIGFYEKDNNQKAIEINQVVPMTQKQAKDLLKNLEKNI